jgi:hypothetical protein
MKGVPRKKTNGTIPHREQLLGLYMGAATLHQLFPQIGQLRIELTFDDPNGRIPPPSSQAHTLFAAAPAFFRFACPCADCDGDFDLTEAVTSLVTGSTGRKRAVSLGGHLACCGVRFRDHAVHQAACSMRLNFQLLSEPSPAS